LEQERIANSLNCLFGFIVSGKRQSVDRHRELTERIFNVCVQQCNSISGGKTNPEGYAIVRPHR